MARLLTLLLTILLIHLILNQNDLPNCMEHGANNVEIMVPLQYLSNFSRILEMPLINCDINIILTLPENSVIIFTDVANQNATFAISDTKLYVPVVTLSTQNNSKLLQQMKSGFKRVISWNKY